MTEAFCEKNIEFNPGEHFDKVNDDLMNIGLPKHENAMSVK